MKSITLYLLISLGVVHGYCQESKQTWEKVFNHYIDSGFSGIVLIVQKGNILLEKGYGFANNETKNLNTPTTLFNVASIGKQFTAVAILKLEEQGLLNTKDLITKYVGKLGGEKDNATIEHLLMHSSGLFVEGTTLNYDSREKFIESVRNTPLESKPGTRHRYSNAGYTLLAAIAEIVTNKPFEDILHNLIFKPSGMTYTGYPWEKRVNKKLLATGYNAKGEAQPAAQNVWGNMGPGNMVTNLTDMKQWFKAWQDSTIISTNIRERMLKDYLPLKETYTWNKVTTKSGKKVFTKGGGRPDFESQLMWVPKDDLFIFFSINNDRNLRRLLYRDLLPLIDNL